MKTPKRNDSLECAALSALWPAAALAPRSCRRLVADLTGAFTVAKLRLVAAGQSADQAAHSKELIRTKRPVDSSPLELQTGREFTYWLVS